ncbi:hypothetical protein D1007_29717 [Hordeum vulgare]|nr:hypothetical protein D1007_29717 [Hordeum vulgare]
MNPGGRFVPVLCEEEAGGTKEDSPALVSSSPGGTSPPAVVGLHLFAIEMGSGTEDTPSSVVLASSAHTSSPACADRDGVRQGRYALRFAVVGLDRHPDSRGSTSSPGTAPRIDLLVLHVSADVCRHVAANTSSPGELGLGVGGIGLAGGGCALLLHACFLSHRRP